MGWIQTQRHALARAIEHSAEVQAQQKCLTFLATQTTNLTLQRVRPLWP
jgi:hypothetical protein